MKRLAVFTSMIALISLPSCKQPKYQKDKAVPKKMAFSFAPVQTNIDVDFQEQALRAQLDDIPTFVGSSFVFIDDKVSENNVSFVLLCKADINLVRDFYRDEMENLGWQKVGQLDATDTTLIFQKPKKICVIAIQASVDLPEVTIHIKSVARVVESLF